MIKSIREHWRKYGTVAMAVMLAIAFVYRSGQMAVHRLDLYSESVLRISPRNVPVPLVRMVQNDSGHKAQTTPLVNNQGDIPRVSYIPPEATVIVTPKDSTKRLEEVVNVEIRNRYGFTFQPGIDIAIAPLGIGLDAKIFYYQRLGLAVGAVHSFVPVQTDSPTAGISYRLDQFRLTRNSELKISYVPLGIVPVQVSIRVNF